MGKFLRRYTNLASALEILQSKKMSFLDPSRWEDKNDADYMSAYKREMRVPYLGALCFTTSEETYHHWRIYSHGLEGVCFRLKAEEFIAAAKDAVSGLECRVMEYKSVKAIEDTKPATRDLPFVKRLPYESEAELRMVVTRKYKSPKLTPPAAPLLPNFLDRIVLSPWLHKTLKPAVVKTLRSIEGFEDIEITRSTLIDYPRWRRARSARPETEKA